MTKGSLQFVPEGWRVVPEEPIEGQLDLIKDGRNYGETAYEIYTNAIKAAPQLTTPPVLRWERKLPHYLTLCIYDHALAYVCRESSGKWYANIDRIFGKLHDTEQQARRAAEKALGIPFEAEEA